MADNFNLRAFLTENKLTKNAKLLNENQEDYKYFDEEGIGGFYLTTIDGVKIYSLEDSSIMDTCSYALEDEDGYIDFISIDVSGEPVSSEDIQNEQEILSDIADFIAQDINSQLEEEEGEDLDEGRYSDSYDSPASKEVHAQLSRISLQDLDAAIAKAEEETGTKVSDLERRVLTNQKHWMNTMDREMEREGVEEGAPSAGMTKKQKSTLAKKAHAGKDIGKKGAGFEKVEKAAEKQYGSKEVAQKVAAAAMWKNAAKHEGMEKDKEVMDENIDVIAQLIDMFPFLTNSTASMLLGAFGAAGLTGFSSVVAKIHEMALKGNFGEGAKAFAQKLQKLGKDASDVTQQKEQVSETTMTARERRLVEMVQDALNAEGYGDDNVNLQRKKQGLPPAQGPKYSEAVTEEEMVEKEPLPEYKTIDELMSSIEHGTNEAAHKHKMDRMKEVAEMLEAKVSSLEEGEHAEHIDQKAVKQMRKDIAALRKAEEKLRKEFDKKFANKDKKEAPKAEKAEALQEGTFDLRKFLAENRK